MDLPTQRHLKPIRESLLCRLHALRTERPGAGQDRPDAAAGDADRSVMEEIARLEAALKRLRVRPEVQRCVRCQAL
jgi:hypothetical protein